LAACVWSAPTHASFILGVGTSLAYDTNVGRVETGARPDLIQSLFGGVLYTEKLGAFSARAIAQAEWRHFYLGTFEDDRTGFLDGSALWTIVPQRLTWVLDDTFREVLLSVTTPDTPANRTQSNALNTGPDVTFSVDPANAILFSARYGDWTSEQQRRQPSLPGLLQGLFLYAADIHVLNYEARRYSSSLKPRPSRSSDSELLARFQTLNTANAGNGRRSTLAHRK
jgi:hypothetical protein